MKLSSWRASFRFAHALGPRNRSLESKDGLPTWKSAIQQVWKPALQVSGSWRAVATNGEACFFDLRTTLDRFFQILLHSSSLAGIVLTQVIFAVNCCHRQLALIHLDEVFMKRDLDGGSAAKRASDSFTEPTASTVAGHRCQIVALYADVPTREWMLRFCKQITHQFLADTDSDIQWWRFKFLTDNAMLKLAVRDASCADIIAYAAPGEADLPPLVKNFTAAWAQRRVLNEAMLVGICHSPAMPLWDPYLRDIAHQNQIQYVSHGYPAQAQTALDGLSNRASEMTPLLQELLHRSRPAARWGINE